MNLYGIHFYWRLIKTQGLMRPEGLGKLTKSFSSGLEPATFPAFSIANTAYIRYVYGFLTGLCGVCSMLYFTHNYMY
jgi:hypothetical protein